MITLKSPAKINLFLRILRKREDGYHELASLFQAVSLFDTLQLSLAKEDQFTCTDPTIPIDERNLVLKALKIFRQKTALTHPVALHLEKNIPAEAGLGGGSSNAATTLWGLNELLNAAASIEELKEWGAKIGADVPFFFSLGTAFCTGLGDKVQEVELSTSYMPIFTLTKPEFGVSTFKAYQNLDLSLLSHRDPDHSLENFLNGNPCYYNDLEEAVLKVEPKLVSYKKEIGSDRKLLSGSGSAFFCIGDDVKLPKGAWSQQVKRVARIPSDWY